ARWKLTSSGAQRHSSRSSARSKGAMIPMPRWARGPSSSMSVSSTGSPPRSRADCQIVDNLGTRSYVVNVPSKPDVVVLHDGLLPPSEPMAPVAEHAELRPTEAAGLAEALRGADVLFAYDFLSSAVLETWHAAEDLRWLHVAAAG